MIYPFFRRKVFLAFLFCFLLMSAVSVNNQLTPAYAKKADQEKVQVDKASDKSASQKELLELITSLRQTIEKLDSRISTIESKLDTIVENNQEETPSDVAEKWISFSEPSKTRNEVEKKPDENIVEVSHAVKQPSNKTHEISEKTVSSSKEPVKPEIKNEIKISKIEDKADKVFLADKTDSKVAFKSDNSANETSRTIEDKTKNPQKQEKVAAVTPKAAPVKENSQKSVKKFRYNITVQKDKENNYEVGNILIGGKKIIAYRSEAGGLDPYARAQIVAQRIEKFLANGVDVRQVQPSLRGGQYIGSVNNDVLFTVDPETADRSGLPIQNLTLSWVNNLRTALGAPAISRTHMSPSRALSPAGRPLATSENTDQLSKNSAIIDMLVPLKPSGIGNVLQGMASWYGPYFHGRRAADGSRYNMYAMTAAHKSLPFGTIVKVTNLNNNRECVVRITDRGPYIHGRIIDLSKAAAQKIGMLGSGTARVKVEVIGKVPRFSRRR